MGGACQRHEQKASPLQIGWMRDWFVGAGVVDDRSPVSLCARPPAEARAPPGFPPPTRQQNPAPPAATRPSFRPRGAAGRPLPPFAPGRLCVLLIALLVVLLCTPSPVAADLPVATAKSYRRVLVLLDALDTKDKYSNFWSSLEDARPPDDGGFGLNRRAFLRSEGCQTAGRASGKRYRAEASLGLTANRCCHLRTVVDFVKKGGNIIVSLDTGFHESWRAMAYEFGIEFDDRNTLVIDHFTHDTAYGQRNSSSHTRLAATNVDSGAGPVLGPSDPSGQRKRVELEAPVLYEGVGHRLSSNNNSLVLNLLRGDRFSYSYQVDRTPDSDPLIGGAGTAL
ncbi:MAG: Oligosaccharyltransferase 48 kDa subunit beta-domain-containing protein, partial [Olpidium bornovanus]